MTVVNSLIVNEVLRVHGPDAQRLGLDRLDEDALILGFARWAEGRLKKWLDYAKGALLFVMVSEASSPCNTRRLRRRRSVGRKPWATR
jgi:hypothetical protein